MFCPKCGTNNTGTSTRCVSCGAELVDNQPTRKKIGIDLILSRIAGMPAKTKKLPRAIKRISVAVIALLVVAAVFFAVGSAVAGPESVVKGYFKAKLDGNYGKMFSYLTLQQSDFINKEKFEKMMEGEPKLEVLDYEVEEQKSESNNNPYNSSNGLLGLFGATSNSKQKTVKSKNDSELTKNFTVKYTVQGSTKVKSLPVILVKGKGKKLLFWDNYKVALDDIIVSGYLVSVPQEAVVYIDGVLLTETQKASSSGYDGYSNDSSYVNFVVPFIFPGTYELKVTHPSPLFTEYETEIEIDSHNNSFTLSNIIVSDYQVAVPQGVTAYINGVELTETQKTSPSGRDGYSNDSSYINYVVPYILPGIYDLKVKHPPPLFTEYETEIEISGRGRNFTLSNVIVTDYQVSVPQGATAYINGIELTEIQKASSSGYDSYSKNSSVVYIAPYMSPGVYELKVEHPLCSVYEAEIEVDSRRSNSFSASAMRLSSEARESAVKKAEEIYRNIVDGAFSEKPFADLKIKTTGISNKIDDINNRYDYFKSRIKADDGTGYKNITITSFSDDSSQKDFNAQGTYACSLNVKYEYVRIRSNWFTGELTEDSPASGSTSVRFTLLYQDGEWVLEEIGSLNI